MTEDLNTSFEAIAGMRLHLRDAAVAAARGSSCGTDWNGPVIYTSSASP